MNLCMGDMSPVGNDFLGGKKGPLQLTMPDVEIRVVDGVPVVSHSRAVHRIADYRGAHHNNLQHIHDCGHRRHRGGHRGSRRGTTLCFDGGGEGDIVRETGICRWQSAEYTWY